MCEAADQSGGVSRLKLLETTAIDNAGDDLAGVGELVEVDGGEAVKLTWVVKRCLHGKHIQFLPMALLQGLEDVAADLHGMLVVLRQMVGNTRNRGVHLAAAEFFGCDHLAGGRLHQRGATEIDGALVAHDDGLVAHGWHIGAARGTHAHHDGDLWDAHGRHAGLVVEETPEVVAVGEHRVLLGQEGAAAIDHIHTGKVVLHGDLLGAEVLLHRILHIGAALHRGVVGHDDRLTALDDTNTGDDARRRKVVVVGVVSRHWRELQKRRVRVDEQVDALTGQQLVAFLVLGHGTLAAALHRGGHRRTVLCHQLHEVPLVLLELLGVGLDIRFQYLHGTLCFGYKNKKNKLLFGDILLFLPKKDKRMKKRILLFGWLLWSFYGFAQVIENSPITNLEAVIYDNDTVLLTWGLPEEYSSLPMILSWTRSDTVEDQIQYGMDSFMAHFYDADDLENFQGWKIDAVVYQKVCNWAYELYVWEQVPGEDMELVFIQEIPDSVPLGKYIINLQEDIHIEPNVQYYFGIRAYWESGKDRAYPFAVDNGPVVTGKGLLLKSKLEGGWDPTSYYVPCNFWLQVYVSNSYDSKEIPIKEDPSLSGYRIYRDGELINEIPYSFVTYFKDTEYTRGFDVEYCVTALYGDEESEPVCVTATITGANEIDSPEKFTISPNPTSGIVRIEGETIAEIKVYNTLGQLVKTVKNTNVIDLKGLPKGVYSLSITEESGGVVLKKVIKE